MWLPKEKTIFPHNSAFRKSMDRIMFKRPSISTKSVDSCGEKLIHYSCPQSDEKHSNLFLLWFMSFQTIIFPSHPLILSFSHSLILALTTLDSRKEQRKTSSTENKILDNSVNNRCRYLLSKQTESQTPVILSFLKKQFNT
jgi:hypothetical protein